MNRLQSENYELVKKPTPKALAKVNQAIAVHIRQVDDNVNKSEDENTFTQNTYNCTPYFV